MLNTARPWFLAVAVIMAVSFAAGCSADKSVQKGKDVNLKQLDAKLPEKAPPPAGGPGQKKDTSPVKK